MPRRPVQPKTAPAPAPAAPKPGGKRSFIQRFSKQYAAAPPKPIPVPGPPAPAPAPAPTLTGTLPGETFSAPLLAGRSPAEDPAFLAFLRASGLDESEIRGEVDYRTAMIKRAAARQLPQFATALQRGQENISTDFENRGFLQSGARQVAQTNQASDVLTQQGDYLAGVQDNLSDINRTAMQKIAGLRRQGLEQNLDARSRVSLRNPQNYQGL